VQVNAEVVVPVQAPTKAIIPQSTPNLYANYTSSTLYISSEDSSAIAANDFSLENLTNCKVYIMQVLRALRMNQLTECLVVMAPVNGSIFIENCNNCTFVIASQQLRIHTTQHTTFYVYSRSHPIIEDSDKLWFSTYQIDYPKKETFLQECGFDQHPNMWDHVEDFNWQKVGVKSPHWNILNPEKVEIIQIPPIAENI